MLQTHLITMDPDLKLVLEEFWRRCHEQIKQAFFDLRTTFSKSLTSQ
jgi:hypothetical protein